MNKKWTPGQRLNSAAEVMQALLDGEKLTSACLQNKPGERFIQLKYGKILDAEGSGRAIFSDEEYTIYTPPKRKVKSERWFAVYKGGRDGTFWSSDCDTEEFARKVYPHALTYVRAECEVEID